MDTDKLKRLMECMVGESIIPTPIRHDILALIAERDEAVALLNKVLAQDLGSVDDDVVLWLADFLARIKEV